MPHPTLKLPLPFLSDNAVIAAAPEQISSDLSGESVLLSLKSGIYYGLNEVGTFIWNLIQQPNTVQNIREAVLAEYDVDADMCDRDVNMILKALLDAELIEVSHENLA